MGRKGSKKQCCSGGKGKEKIGRIRKIARAISAAIIIGNAVTKGQPSPKANFAFLLIDFEVVGEKLGGSNK